MSPSKTLIDWPGTLRRGLQVVVFCGIVAVLTTAIWPNSSYWVQAGNSLSIGLVTWAVIEFGRYFIDQRYCHHSARGGHGWPKGWRGLILVAVGIGCGFFVGDSLGRYLFGNHGLRNPHDDQVGLILTIIAGAAATFYFHLRGKAASLLVEKAAAERDASEAQLRLLQSQLEPHMLFNTLANLRALIGIDPAAAQQMVDRLNDYLRATLSASRATTHPLAAEFERLRDYLELMTIRMGARLQYSLELPDHLRSQSVPTLLLQPLVENAIKHGLEPKVGGGTVTVRAASGEAGHLVLEVLDSGIGYEPEASRTASPSGSGFGLAQVFERVATAYAGLGSVSVQSEPGVGTMVRIDLPQ